MIKTESNVVSLVDEKFKKEYGEMCKNTINLIPFLDVCYMHKSENGVETPMAVIYMQDKRTGQFYAIESDLFYMRSYFENAFNRMRDKLKAYL